MAHVERDIFIQASPEQVTTYVGNPANTSQWYAGVVEARSEYNEPVMGGTVTQTYTVAGRNSEMEMTVIGYEPARMIELQLDGMIKGTFRWDFMPEGSGTRMKGTVDYEMGGGILGQIADKLVVERMNVSQLEESLENLKRIMES